MSLERRKWLLNVPQSFLSPLNRPAADNLRVSVRAVHLDDPCDSLAHQRLRTLIDEKPQRIRARIVPNGVEGDLAACSLRSLYSALQALLPTRQLHAASQVGYS